MEKNHPKWEWKKNWDIIKHAVNFNHIHPIPLKKKKAVETNFWKLYAGRLISFSQRIPITYCKWSRQKNSGKGSRSMDNRSI